MNVVDKSNLKISLMKDVPPGTLFVYEDEKFIRSEVDPEGDYIALNVVTGDLWFFNEEDEVVERPDAELVLG